jgi:hypothetical protein
MDERLSIRRKAGKSRAHTNARTEPVINAAVTVRHQEQPNRAREPRENIYTRRKQNPPTALPLVAVLSEIRLRRLVAMAASAVCARSGPAKPLEVLGPRCWMRLTGSGRNGLEPHCGCSATVGTDNSKHIGPPKLY